jgi:hypothetical protein
LYDATMCLSVHQSRTICSFDIWAISLPSVMKACLMPTHTPFWAMLSLSVEQHLPANTTASTIARSTITFLVSPPLPSLSHYTPSSSIVIRLSIHYTHNTPTTENDINIRNIRYGCTPVPDRDLPANMSPPTPSTSPSKLHWLRSLAKRIRKGFRKFRAQGLQTEMPTITITHPTNTHEEIEQPTSLIHRKDWPSPSYQQLCQWFTPEFAKILYTRGFPPTVTPTTCFCAFVIHEAERFMDPYNIGEFPRSIGDLRETLSLIFTEVDVDTTRLQIFTEDRSSSLSFDCIGKRYVRKRPLMIWISHIAETIIWGDDYAEPPSTDILSVVDDSVNRDNFTPGIEHLSRLQIRSVQFQHGTDGPPVADLAGNPSERSNKSIDTMQGVDSPQEGESQTPPSPAPPGPEDSSQPPLASPGPEGDLQSSLAALRLEDDSQQQSSDAVRQQSTARPLSFGLEDERLLTRRQGPGDPASNHVTDLVRRAARENEERNRQRQLLQQDGEQEPEAPAPNRFATAYHRFAGLGRSAARRNGERYRQRQRQAEEQQPESPALDRSSTTALYDGSAIATAYNRYAGLGQRAASRNEERYRQEQEQAEEQEANNQVRRRRTPVWIQRVGRWFRRITRPQNSTQGNPTGPSASTNTENRGEATRNASVSSGPTDWASDNDNETNTEVAGGVSAESRAADNNADVAARDPETSAFEETTADNEASVAMNANHMLFNDPAFWRDGVPRLGNPFVKHTETSAAGRPTDAGCTETSAAENTADDAANLIGTSTGEEINTVSPHRSVLPHTPSFVNPPGSIGRHGLAFVFTGNETGAAATAAEDASVEADTSANETTTGTAVESAVNGADEDSESNTSFALREELEMTIEYIIRSDAPTTSDIAHVRPVRVPDVKELTEGIVHGEAASFLDDFNFGLDSNPNANESATEEPLEDSNDDIDVSSMGTLGRSESPANVNEDSTSRPPRNPDDAEPPAQSPGPLPAPSNSAGFRYGIMFEVNEGNREIATRFRARDNRGVGAADIEVQRLHDNFGRANEGTLGRPVEDSANDVGPSVNESFPEAPTEMPADDVGSSVNDARPEASLATGTQPGRSPCGRRYPPSLLAGRRGRAASHPTEMPPDYMEPNFNYPELPIRQRPTTRFHENLGQHNSHVQRSSVVDNMRYVTNLQDANAPPILPQQNSVPPPAQNQSTSQTLLDRLRRLSIRRALKTVKHVYHQRGWKR